MASIRVINVGNVKYLQVIDHYSDNTGHRKIKVVKSFGQDTLANRMEAETFLANYNAAEKIKQNNPEMDKDQLLDNTLKIGGGILAAFVGLKILKWLFDEKDKKT